MSTAVKTEKNSKINTMFSNFPGMAKKEDAPPPVVNPREVADDGGEYVPPSPEGLSASSVAIAAVSEVVAALAVNPNFSSLSSNIEEERNRASKEAGRLVLAIASGAEPIINLGFDKTDAMKAVSHVLSKAWVNNESPHEAANKLFLYAKKIDSLAGKHGPRVIGLPDRSELENPDQSAQKFYSTQFGVNATLGIKDDGLSGWFMNQVRRFDQKSVVSGIKAASDMSKDLPQLAFMSNESSEIVLLSSAAAMTKVVDLYQKSLNMAGEDFTVAVLGKENVHMGLAFKSIIAKGVEAIENISVDGTNEPDEATVARAIGSMITELSRPWLNTRINLFNNAWKELPLEMRNELKSNVATKRSAAERDAGRVMAMPDVRKSIMSKNKPVIEKSIGSSNFLVSIAESTPLINVSSMIKLRGELIRADFDEASVVKIETAVSAASDSFAKKKADQPVKVGGMVIPALKVGYSQDNIPIAWATMTSVQRKIIESAGKKTNNDPVAMVDLISQGMDAIAALSGADPSAVKASLRLSIKEMDKGAVMESIKQTDKPTNEPDQGNL